MTKNLCFTIAFTIPLMYNSGKLYKIKVKNKKGLCMKLVSLELTNVATLQGFLRWAAIVLLTVITISLLIKRHNSEKPKNFAFVMLFATIIAAPFLAIDIIETQEPSTIVRESEPSKKTPKDDDKKNGQPSEKENISPDDDKKKDDEDKSDDTPNTQPTHDDTTPRRSNNTRKKTTPANKKSDKKEEGGAGGSDTPTPAKVSYKVIHKKMDLDGTNYTIADTENKTGYASSSVTPSRKSYYGFKTPSKQTKTLPNTDGYEIIYLYERAKFKLTLTDADRIQTTTPAGQYYYESPITLTAKAKDGYTFTKWSDDSTNATLSFNLKADKTVGPEYSANNYRILFNGNGSTSGEMMPQTTQYDKDTVLSQNQYTKEHYVFNKWNTSADGQGTGYADKATVRNLAKSGDFNLYATWLKDIREATVQPGSLSLTVGDFTTITVSNTDGMEPYSFSSNNTNVITVDQNGKVTAIASGSAKVIITGEKSGKTIEIDVTVNEPAPTTVTYRVIHMKQNIDNDNYTPADTDQETGTIGTPVTPPAKNYTGFNAPATQTETLPSTDGYEFIYKYDRKEYDLTLTNSNYIETTTPTGQYRYEKQINLKAKTREGYTFAKWTNNNTNSEISFEIKSNTTIGPEYTPNQYNIVFNGNGSTAGEMSNQTVNYDETFQLNKNLYTREHYIFMGWNTSADGQGTNYTDEQANLKNLATSGNYTLYAIWLKDIREATVQPSEITLDIDDNATIALTGTDNMESYSFSSNDDSIATVDQDGKVTAIAAGSTKIIITGELSGETIEIDVTVNQAAPALVCKAVKEEERLHTDKCTNGSCTSAGHTNGTIITFGTIQDNNSPKKGDAFNCDVNNDGIYNDEKERFYYLDGDDITATLIFYSGYEGEAKENNENNYNYRTAATMLPTAEQWSNPNLVKFYKDYDEDGATEERIARYITYPEITNLCNSVLSNCEFIYENTRYLSTSTGRSGMWIEKYGNTYYRYQLANRAIGTYSSYDSGKKNAVRPVIEVPTTLIEQPEQTPPTDQIDEFNPLSAAIQEYYSKISEWSSDKDTLLDSLQTNFEGNQCNIPSYNDSANFISNRSYQSGNVKCDLPTGYDTGVNGAVKVFLSDTSLAKGDEVSYTKSSNGKIYNLIPNQIYRWEDSNDETVYGYVKATADKRVIYAGATRNLRDLGGMAVDSDGDGVNDSTLKYGRLLRGERLWNNGEIVGDLKNLGITEEFNLATAAQLNGDTRFEDGKYVESEPGYYKINPAVSDEISNYTTARNTVKLMMQEIVAGKNLYFHCRIGSDRTGTMAYILEGLLGVDEEQRLQDYELSHFSGNVDRTREYDKKVDNDKRFKYMRDFLETNQQVLQWYMHGTTNQAEDEQLIENFRTAMINE